MGVMCSPVLYAIVGFIYSEGRKMGRVLMRRRGGSRNRSALRPLPRRFETRQGQMFVVQGTTTIQHYGIVNTAAMAIVTIANENDD